MKGHEDGNLIHAQFNSPTFGALDSSSTTLFVSDNANHVIRKIDLLTDQVMTLCGTPTEWGWKNRVGSESQFWHPGGLALHEKKNLLYVADSQNHIIRGVNLIDNKVNTLVGMRERVGKTNGIGENATFYSPHGLALDTISDFLYVADFMNHSIRRISLNERKVETICGYEGSGYVDGSFKEALFYHPWNIVLNMETQELYVSDSWNHAIRVLSLKNETVHTLCGIPGVRGYKNGDPAQAEFDYPRGLELDTISQCLYVSDDHQVIRKISLDKKRKVDILCGIPGISGDKNGFISTLNIPRGIVMDPHSRSFYVMDCGSHKVRKVSYRTKFSL